MKSLSSSMRLHAVLVFTGIACWTPAGLALTVTSVSPVNYQVTALAEGSHCFVDRTAPVTDIPPALAGGVLIRTAAADAAAQVAVRFQVDMRCEVYVCCDARTSPPTWTTSWVATDMVVGVADPSIGGYDVYAKRFNGGLVSLPANDSAQMYFIVVRPSAPVLPRNGWVLLSYDMPYLREIICQAPEYNVNHIQLSHDIMMYTWEALEQSERRADLNELIDLAHAYGVTDVTLWTHEFGTHGMPAQYRASDGRVDGDNPGLWEWTKERYRRLFSEGTGCPEVDGVVVTFDEVSMMGEGCEVWVQSCFKHNATGTESARTVINTVQEVCRDYGKTFYARTWAGNEQFYVRDAIRDNNDTDVWMMSKNVGNNDGGWDWDHMDSYHPCIGTLPAGFNELIEFDLCGEYLGRGPYTFIMTSYLKHHWNYAYGRGVRGGMVARIDRGGGLTYHTANRINLYALKEVLANRNADPAAVNLAWCQQQFPADAAQDIADHYDDPISAALTDTRYMTWEAFRSDLSPVTNAQALDIGYKAIARLDKHRAQLEIQTTLDTRSLKTDYQTLRYGIALAILDLGGTVPEALGYSNFRPARPASLNPDCSIDIRLAAPGLDPITVACEFSNDGGLQWASWPAVCDGPRDSIATQTINVAAVPFNQASEELNFIRFHISGVDGIRYDSGVLRVRTAPPLAWSGFRPEASTSLAPNCSIVVTSADQSLDGVTARYQYSTDGGQTWLKPQVNWQGRYDCDLLPWQDGWAIVEGQAGLESLASGTLCINDASSAPGTKVKYARPWTVDPQVGATAEARMQCLSGGHYFGSNLHLADFQHGESLYLKANGMIGLDPTGVLAPAHTSGWHTYRVTILGTDINVYVDGSPEPVIRGKDTFIHAATPGRLLFGSGSSAGTQQICYDYIAWTTEGAFAPTEWRPASYSGNLQSGTITVPNLPFSQYSDSLNKIRFSIDDATGRTCQSPVYTVRISPSLWADLDGDHDVDQSDFGAIQACISGSGRDYATGCERVDHDSDGDVDEGDLQAFRDCFAGTENPPRCE